MIRLDHADRAPPRDLLLLWGLGSHGVPVHTSGPESPLSRVGDPGDRLEKLMPDVVMTPRSRRRPTSDCDLAFMPV